MSHLMEKTQQNNCIFFITVNKKNNTYFAKRIMKKKMEWKLISKIIFLALATFTERRAIALKLLVLNFNQHRCRVIGFPIQIKLVASENGRVKRVQRDKKK